MLQKKCHSYDFSYIEFTLKTPLTLQKRFFCKVKTILLQHKNHTFERQKPHFCNTLINRWLYKEYIYKKYLYFYDFSPLTLYIVEPPY